MRTWIKIVLAISLIASLLLIGYIQYSYVINFLNSKQNLLLERKQFVGMNYNTKTLVSGEDPRAYSMLFYAFSSFILSLGTIWVLFRDKKWAVLTSKIYFFGYFFGLLVLGISVLLSAGDVGFSLFQKIKNALSSSYIIFFLIPLFMYFNNESKN